MEILFAAATGQTHYINIQRVTDGFWWETTGPGFETFDTGSFGDYDVAATEYGTSGVYHATFPAGITTGGEYKVWARQRVGGAPAQSDPVVWEERVWWSGSAPTAPPPPSASPEQVTGYLYVYDEEGVVEPGVDIICRAVAFNDEAEEVGLVVGFALDSAARTETSDGTGLVQFTNLFKGVTYSITRGNGGYSASIPADADDPYQLPSIIGEDA